MWRRLVVHRRNPPATVASLKPPARPGRLAVFVPAWHEDAVIERMMRAALARFDHRDFCIFVGVYPNDPATAAAVAALARDDARVVQVVNVRDGPTTKADNLNNMWRALLADEVVSGRRYKAVVLHDAEDVVHPAELRMFDLLVERFDLVQLPVLPLVDRSSRWIAGHYMDEFAESHGKQLVVREMVGAGMPSAGVGCALSRRAVDRLAAAGDGAPFAADSLTEDYEVGLRLAEFGWRGIFVRIASHPGGPPVAVRAYFPGSWRTAIRQKTRWILGIALTGWDRLGWRGHPGDFWMRLRDRRSPFAALIILLAYAVLILSVAVIAAHWIAGQALPDPPAILFVLLWANFGLLLWRLVMRFVMVARVYGWREGARAVPRILIANAILIAAAGRAAWQYVRSRSLRTALVWDKTAHRFPAVLPGE